VATILVAGSDASRALKLAAAAGVEVAGWLVEHQDLRLAGQHAGKGHPAFLAAAEAVGGALLETGSALLAPGTASRGAGPRPG